MHLSKALFFLTAAATTTFIVTILAMVAMLVGDPEAPVNLWFNDHGAVVMTVEVVAIGVLGMSAMIADRRETLREQRNAAKNRAGADGQETSRQNPPNPFG